MMKKEYIQPEMEVVEIVVSPLLAGSANTLFDDTAGGDESLAPDMPGILDTDFTSSNNM